MSTEKKEPYAWVVRGMRDGEGDSIGDVIKWRKAEAKYLNEHYRNGLRREHRGYLLPLYIDEDYKE